MLLLAGCADNNWLVAGRLSTCVPHGRQFNTDPSVIQGQPPHPAGFSAAAEQLSTLQLWSADWGLGRRRKIKTLVTVHLQSSEDKQKMMVQKFSEVSLEMIVNQS